MKRPADPILGVTAPRARPTVAGATWVALAVTIPAAGLLLAVEVMWRWLSGG